MDDGSFLKNVFSDALIIDIDFSEWDDSISIVCVADHLPEQTDATRKRIVVLQFIGVSQFDFALTRPSYVEREVGQHIQWRIDDIRIEPRRNGHSIALSGSNNVPTLTISYEKLQTTDMPNEDLDMLFPGWSRPWSGLARPGLKSMLKSIRGCY